MYHLCLVLSTRTSAWNYSENPSERRLENWCILAQVIVCGFVQAEKSESTTLPHRFMKSWCSFLPFLFSYFIAIRRCWHRRQFAHSDSSSVVRFARGAVTILQGIRYDPFAHVTYTYVRTHVHARTKWLTASATCVADKIKLWRLSDEVTGKHWESKLIVRRKKYLLESARG